MSGMRLPGVLDLTTGQGDIPVRKATGYATPTIGQSGANAATNSIGGATWSGATTAGSVVLAAVVLQDSSALVNSVPSGWTLVTKSTDGGGNPGLWIYKIENAASQSGTPLWGFSTSTPYNVLLLEIVNGSVVTDYASRFLADANTGVSSPSLTNSSETAMMVAFAGTYNSGSFSSPTNGFTEVLDNSGNASAAAWYKAVTASASQSMSATFSANTSERTVMVAVSTLPSSTTMGKLTKGADGLALVTDSLASVGIKWAARAQVAEGSYTGDGTDSRLISLTFTPKFVAVVNETDADVYFLSPPNTATTGARVRSTSSLAQDQTVPRPTTNGFLVGITSNAVNCNENSKVFHYFAIG